MEFERRRILLSQTSILSRELLKIVAKYAETPLFEKIARLLENGGGKDVTEASARNSSLIVAHAGAFSGPNAVLSGTDRELDLTFNIRGHMLGIKTSLWNLARQLEDGSLLLNYYKYQDEHQLLTNLFERIKVW
jgi:hypothetical protein